MEGIVFSRAKRIEGLAAKIALKTKILVEAGETTQGGTLIKGVKEIIDEDINNITIGETERNFVNGIGEIHFAPIMEYSNLLKDYDNIIDEIIENNPDAKKEEIEAFKSFNQGIVSNDSHYYQALLGDYYHTNGYFRKAEFAYKKSIDIEPNFHASHTNYGFLLQKIDKLPESTEEFKKALKLNENDFRSHYDIAINYEVLKEYQKAIKRLFKSIEIYNEFSDAHFNLACIYQKIGEKDNAISEYEKVIEIDPKYFDAYKNLGGLLFENGEINDAKDAFLNALKIEDFHPGAHYNLAECHIKLGEFELARVQLLEAQRQDNNMFQYPKKLGWLYDRMGEHDKAIDALHRAITLNSSDQGLWTLLKYVQNNNI